MREKDYSGETLGYRAPYVRTPRLRRDMIGWEDVIGEERMEGALLLAN